MSNHLSAVSAPYDACIDLPSLDPGELVVTAMPLLSQTARRHHQNCHKCRPNTLLTVVELMRCFARSRVEA